MKRIAIFTCSLLLSHALTSLANEAPRTQTAPAARPAQNAPSTMEKVRTAIYDVLDTDTVALGFSKGAATVDEGMKQKVRALLQAVKKNAQVDKIFLASWADQKLPADSKQDLTEAEQDLAAQRAENLEKFLDAEGYDDVDVLNMARQASWMGKTLGTDDAQVKESMKGHAVSDGDMRALAKKLESKGGAGKLVVAVVRDTEPRSPIN